MNGILGPGGLDERFLTRNAHAARQLAALLIRQGAHGAGARLPRVRDVAELLGVGNGTVQSALRLLEEAGAIKTVARGHLGTFLVGSDRAALWRLSGLGAVQAAMPLPHSRRFEGLATGLRAAFEEAAHPSRSPSCGARPPGSRLWPRAGPSWQCCPVSPPTG